MSASHAFPDSSIVSNFWTVSSAAMMDRMVKAVAKPSNVIPRRVEQARADFVLSNLQDSPSSLGVKLMFPANKMAETKRISELIVWDVKPIVVC
jgi:hypothetical protein